MERSLRFDELTFFRVGQVRGLSIYKMRDGSVALCGGEDEFGYAAEGERKAVYLNDEEARALSGMLQEASEPK